MRYLSEIAESNRAYNTWCEEQAEVAGKLASVARSHPPPRPGRSAALIEKAEEVQMELDPKLMAWLDQWPALRRGIAMQSTALMSVESKSISKPRPRACLNCNIPKVSVPRIQRLEEICFDGLCRRIYPVHFPFTAGIYPFKRQGEDPARMFAGEGGPERTNKRFHYVSVGMPAKRLSTAFDSVTLYGRDPDVRPDIYGKVGNSGVSVCSLDDAKKLYSGFDLCDPATSVSMTINGPAPMILGFFLNAAIDQTCEKFIRGKGLEKDVEALLKKKWDDQGLQRPTYHGELPDGHNGLGLLFWDVQEMKSFLRHLCAAHQRGPHAGARNRASRYSQGRSSPKYVHLLH